MRLPSTLKICLLLASVCASASCKKYQDEPGNTDPRLSRKYCNDPEAVNYNFDFPGTADNSICFYPSDAFSGDYVFTDTVYSSANQIVRLDSLHLQLGALSHTKLTLKGFCSGGNDLLRFTANRQLRATADTVVLNGQLLCRPKDTISGVLTRRLGDSLGLRIFLTVVSDTGVTTHSGTAYKR